MVDTTVPTEERAQPEVAAPGRLPRFARWPVLAVAGGVALLLLLGSGWDGYFFDELYFLAAGRYHLSVGYADQPPLVPLLARVMDTVLPGSPTGIRLPAVLVTVVGVVLAALTAREFGGARRAQVMAAAAYAVSFAVVTINHWLATYTVDPLWWTLVIWLLVRWVRTRGDRLLLFAGVVTAVALQTKFLIPGLWVAVGAGVLIVGPRDLLRRPLLWVGAAAAVVTTLPGLAWQARHGWPQVAMTQQVAREADMGGGRLVLLPSAVLTAGVLVGAVLCCYGLWRLLRSPELRAYRFLGVAVLGVAAIFLISDGQARYLVGLYPLLFAAAAVEIERGAGARWWRWAVSWPSYLVAALAAVVMFVVLVDAQAPANRSWRPTALAVVQTYRALPAGQRAHTAVMTEIYPTAAALEVFGRPRGLPQVYSPYRGYWYFGAPPAGDTAVLYLGDDAAKYRRYFSSVRRVGPSDQPLWLCTGLRRPWQQIWPGLRAV